MAIHDTAITPTAACTDPPAAKTFLEGAIGSGGERNGTQLGGAQMRRAAALEFRHRLTTQEQHHD